MNILYHLLTKVYTIDNIYKFFSHFFMKLRKFNFFNDY